MIGTLSYNRDTGNRIALPLSGNTKRFDLARVTDQMTAQPG